VQVPVELPHGVSYDGIFGGGVGAEADVRGFMGTVGAKRASMSVQQAAPMALAPAARAERDTVAAKLDPRLRALARGTVVRVKLWLTDDSPTVMVRLKQLGLSVTRQASGKIVYGRADAGVLAAIAAENSVLFVSQDIGQP
jgi:hypothetical protein